MTDTQTALEAASYLAYHAGNIEHPSPELVSGVNNAYAVLVAALQSRTEQEPVAEIAKKTYGSYSPNYTLKWFSEVGVGEKLYASPPDQSARIAELEAEKQELLDAIESLTGDVEHLGEDVRDAEPLWFRDIFDSQISRITVGDLRAAATLRNKLKEK